MNESNVIPKIFKINIIHNYNYLINEKYNIIVKTYMNKIAGLKKKINIFFVNVKNIKNDLINYFNIIREEKLASLNKKFERKFV